MPESELRAVSYVKNTGKPARRVFDHIGQRLFFVQRRTPVEMLGVPSIKTIPTIELILIVGMVLCMGKEFYVI